MSRRAQKQFLYGLSFLLFWGVIFGGIYFFWFGTAPSCFDNKQNQDETGIDCGGPCVSCAITNAKPIMVQAVRVLPVGSRFTILGSMVNPNEQVSAESFDYIFDLYGPTDELLRSISGKGFIYSGELKYIILPALEVQGRVVRADLSIANPKWREGADFASPLVRLRESKTEVRSDGQVITSGILVNEGNLPVSIVTVQAIYKSGTGTIIGASQTEVRDLMPLQNRRFDIPHPSLEGLDARLTQVLFEAR